MKFIVPKIQKLKKIIYIFIYNIFVHITKMNNNKILIASNRSKELTGNLKSIYEELIKYNYKIKILLADNTNVKYNIKFIYEMSNSKYIIIDDFFPLVYPLKIRKNAKLIQVWHAMGAFKKVGFSRIGKEGGPSITSLTHKNYTDVIVSSENIVNNYAEAFAVDKEKIHAIGTPRTDMFFNEDLKEKLKQEIYEKYPKLKGKRIIIFAPTFRGNGKKSAHYPKEYFKVDRIYNNLNENDMLLIKYHPFIKEKIEIKENQCDKIIDMTEFKDINQLLLIADLLITDYSSVIFEYALLEKPIIYYVPDLEAYQDSRDFYYNFNEYCYGECCNNLEDLIKQMRKASLDREKLEIFKDKFLNMCDGKSTERFVKKIIMEK